jgi:hypothetical protein
MNRKKNWKKPPPTTLSGILIDGLRAHWKAGTGVLALLACAAWVAAVVADAAGTGDGRPARTVCPIPLTEGNLRAWSDRASDLAGALDRDGLCIPAQSMPGFIAWAQRNPERLRARLSGYTLVEFLSIARSIHEARVSLRKSVEHDLCREEEGKILETLGEAGSGPGECRPLDICGPAERNLEIYEQNLDRIETALEQLLPGIPCPVPAWQTSWPGDPEPKDVRTHGRVNLGWRVVNRSRYGPRVLRLR